MIQDTKTHRYFKRLYLTVGEQAKIYLQAKAIAQMKLKVILTYCDDTMSPKTRLTILTRKTYSNLLRALLIENCFSCSRVAITTRDQFNTLMITQESN
jgi:hypothetical protein